jgi:hypothetical protein
MPDPGFTDEEYVEPRRTTDEKSFIEVIKSPREQKGPIRIKLENVEQWGDGNTNSMMESPRNVALPDINVTRLKSHRNKNNNSVSESQISKKNLYQ